MQREIDIALEILNNGGTILYPTDTIWGIGCDATNAQVVDKVFNIKGREQTKSMLVLIDNDNMLYDYIDTIPEIAFELLDAAVNPLTIIYPGGKNMASKLLAEDGSIGIRIVQDDFCKKLIQKFGKPLVSTSANVSGRAAPKSFKDIDAEIIAAVDYVVRWRQDDVTPSRPSGIIKLGVNGEVVVIRE